MRVLIVEDDRREATELRQGLTRERHQVVIEATGEGGFFRCTTEHFDLLLLDLSLPGRDALAILKAVRLKKPSIPVIVLAARDSVADRVAALDSGADDFVVKPCDFIELLARIRALLRRSAVVTISDIASVGPVTLNRLTRVVTRDGRAIPLTGREFELLEYLMRYEGAPVSREAIARDVWKEAERTPSLDNVMDVHIVKLRRKIDTNPSATLLHTVRGVGFMMGEGEAPPEPLKNF